MPENVAPGRPETPGQFLRAWGNIHPTLSTLRGMLKAYPQERQRQALPGLYIDSARAPWVAVRGEIRVSLARLISVSADGKHQLLGQVQATASEKHLNDSCTLRFYLHQPAGVIAREVNNENQWWVELLEQHYSLGGKALDNLEAVAV